VPHLFGKTDADAAYGLAWVECEDDWTNVEDGILAARGRLASARGKDWATVDYLCQLFRIQSFVDAKYDKELSPDTRAVVEAFAEGITHFAATHRDRMPDMALPVTGKDIVAGAALKTPFFYDLQTTLLKVMSGEHGAMVGKKGVQTSWIPARNPFAPEGTIGSNAWAVGPSRSADGATRLAINSHMPWEGPVTFYEAHVHSEQGWNMTGGTFPGGPMIFLGHDENRGWCHTINRPDLADVYELELNPDNPNQYKLDGAWRDFERGTARITVRFLGPIRWTFKRELLWSEHGPVLRTPKGARAIRFAGFGEVGQLEQWYRMNKARNLDEFRAAMRLLKLSSLNTLYADKQGNLFYAYNAQFPVRAEGFDWGGTLPGNTSKALWTGTYPFDNVPQVINPPSGFIQSCNSTPFRTTDGSGNPTPGQFPAAMGIETEMTNRALRALETYGADPSITRDAFYAYKYDKTYSKDSLMSRFLDELFASPPPADPGMKEAFALLKGWNRCMDKDSRAAGLAVLAAEEHNDFWHRPEVPEKPAEALRRAVDTMMKKHGRLDVPWGEMLRLRHGKVDLGLGGGPDCMRAVDVAFKDDGRFVGVNGDCYVLLVEWNKGGEVHSESIHQYGSATLDTKSSHYADQAPLFAEEKRKPVWFSEADIRAHLKREYRPGEIRGAWYASQ
ncbi:MAG: penicillin acylase family protein, partial [Candidatus Hydrogenedentes bacterium]|nr:penicillin acylase family protein [Candidatus Hydrogenedentota bacterium]